MNRASRGFSLIELLVVLVIVGVLAVVAVSTVGNRPAAAVRSVMDEVEGVLAAAHKRTTSTQGDVILTTRGVWGSLTDPTILTFTGASAPADSFLYTRRSRDYDYAGIACGTDWANDAITSLGKVKPTDKNPFLEAIGRPLFTGAPNPVPPSSPPNPTDPQPFVINGYNKRYSQGFYVAVVGIRNGQPITSGPVGILVVPGGGNSIYKFYRSNSADTWRRL